MTLDYAYIVLGNITIEGWIDCYEWRNDTIIIVIDKKALIYAIFECF